MSRDYNIPSIENRLNDIRRAAAVIRQLSVARIHDESELDPVVSEQSDWEIVERAEEIVAAHAAIFAALERRGDEPANRALFLAAPLPPSEA